MIVFWWAHDKSHAVAPRSNKWLREDLGEKKIVNQLIVNRSFPGLVSPDWTRWTVSVSPVYKDQLCSPDVTVRYLSISLNCSGYSLLMALIVHVCWAPITEHAAVPGICSIYSDNDERPAQLLQSASSLSTSMTIRSVVTRQQGTVASLISYNPKLEREHLVMVRLPRDYPLLGIVCW